MPIPILVKYISGQLLGFFYAFLLGKNLVIEQCFVRIAMDDRSDDIYAPVNDQNGQVFCRVVDGWRIDL
jgi:hypothetical protein